MSVRRARGADRFHERLAAGSQGYVLRLDQLLTRFADDTSDDEVDALTRRGVDEAGAARDLSADREDRRYVTLRRARKRLLAIPPQPDAGALFAYARELLARNATRMVYAWPVYEAEGKPGSSAASPLLDTFIVRLDDTPEAERAHAALRELGLTRHDALSRLLAPYHYYRLAPGGDPLRGVELHEQVTGLAPLAHFDWQKVDAYSTPGAPNDQYWARQWNMRAIEALPAWSARAAVADARVAVIDSGFDLSQADLLPYSPPAEWFNVDEALAGSTGPYLPAPCGDPHGTAVAGIVGARHGNARGIAGVADACDILPIRLGLEPSAARAAACLRWASDPARNVRVINMSFGAVPLPVLTDAVGDALQADIVLCAAAGNYWPGEDHSVEYPASDPGVIAVGAAAKDDTRKLAGPPGGTWASKYGVELDVIAPGVEAPTTDESGGQGFNPDTAGALLDGLDADYVIGYGTSVAAPHVAGLAALILSRFPGLSAAQVKRSIVESAVRAPGYPLNAPDAAHPAPWNEEIGCGRIDCRAALDRAAELSKESAVPMDADAIDRAMTLLQDKGTECPGMRALRGVHFEQGSAGAPCRLFLTLDMDEWVEFDTALVRWSLRNTDQTWETPLGFWVVWVAADAELHFNRVRSYHDRQDVTADFLRGELAARLRTAPGMAPAGGPLDGVVTSTGQPGQTLGYSTVSGPCH